MTHKTILNYYKYNIFIYYLDFIISFFNDKTKILKKNQNQIIKIEIGKKLKSP